jgi:hypothetical protein
MEKEDEKKVEEKKKKSFLDKLSDGDWIDSLSGKWGKPKEFNKDWNK